MRKLFLFVFLASIVCTPGTQIFAAFSPESASPLRINSYDHHSADSSGSGNSIQNISIAVAGSVCESATLKLKPSFVNPAYTYEWVLPNGAVIKNVNYTIDKATLSDGGAYQLNVFFQGETFSTKKLITINPLPELDFKGETMVCENSNLVLAAKNDSAIAYSWWKGQVAIQKTNVFSIEKITAAASGTYLLSAKKSGCVSSKYFTVQVKPSATKAVIISKNEICENETLKLTAQDAGVDAKYSWTGPSFKSNNAIAIIENVKTIQSGDYLLTVIKDGCAANDKVSIKINNLPKATFSGNTSVCEQSKLELTATENSSNTIYQWRSSNGSVVTGQKLFIDKMNENKSGNYSLIVTANGCTSTAIASVTVKPLPQAKIEAAAVICEGAQMIFKATAIDNKTNFSWSGPAGTVSKTDQLVIENIKKDNEGSYLLQADLDGCETEYVHSLKVKAVTKPIISGINSICEGGDINLFVSNSPAEEINWLTPTGERMSGQNLSINKVAVQASGAYKVTLVSNDCTASESFIVKVKKAPVVQLNNTEPVCQFAPAFSVIANELNGAKGKGSFSGDIITATGEVKTGKEGEFAISYNYKTLEGCSTTTNTVIRIKPGILVNAGDDILKNKEQKVQLKAIVIGRSSQVSWSNISGSELNSLQPFIKPAATTGYIVTVTNQFGCSAKDEVIVKVTDITVPNAFTPNGDGANDKWDIPELKEYPNCQVSVFDIFGKQVFVSKGYTASWDGRSNGSIVPNGTYYYNINLNDRSQTQPIKGWIMIRR
jgi:gliding motility-associated-like protein